MEIFQQLGVFVEVETHGAPMGPLREVGPSLPAPAANGP